MPPIFAVGYRTLEVPDAALGLVFPVAVLYPTQAPAQATRVGPYWLDVAPQAPVAGSGLPLVVISHGTGGSPWVYRGLAHHLARHGYAVGLPEHPHNHRHDNSWEGTHRNLTARPRHLQLAISALYEDAALAPALRPACVGVVGHSMGGYTALASAGGQPTGFPWESPDGQAHPVPVAPDARIRALVLLAPATPWFRAAGALRGVRVPVLLLTAELDAATSYEHSQLVVAGLPAAGRLTHRVVPNAGHFAFLSPFPAAMATPAFLPSQDPPGFDRLRFQEELCAEVTAFLAQALPPTGPGQGPS